MNTIAAGKITDLKPGTMKRVQTDVGPLMICNVEGNVYAVSDECTHTHASLSAGILEGAAVECPRHGARFDVITGKVLALPAARPIRTYPVTIQNGTIEITLAAENKKKEGGCCGGGCCEENTGGSAANRNNEIHEHD